jgi:bifunctional non-homologous end joining protein LigD
MVRKKQDLERTLVMPAEFLPLSHPTLVAKPPEGAGWIHEIKYDGWRMQLNVAGGRATWWTRNGHDWTGKLGVLSVFAGELPDCILDGEVCALDDDGSPSFSALQSAMAGGRTDELIFFAFDLLFRGEADLRPYALETRKASLARVLVEGGEAIQDHIRNVDHFPDAPARQLHRAACEMRLEGIVSKRLDENYKAGRNTAWLKAKCRPGQELVVGGWKAARGGHFKGLLTGVYEGGELVYAGSVKNGFGEREVRQLMPRLKALHRECSPFGGKTQPTASGGDRLHFVEPRLVAQADIAEWTASRKVRQASFKGLREDKEPEEVRREG